MRAMPGWNILWVLVTALCVTTTVMAREVELHLKDGRVIKGTLVGETPDRVIVSVSGISTPFDRSAISKQTVRLTLLEEFDAEMEKIKAGDTASMFELAYNMRGKASQAVAAGNLEEAKAAYQKVLGLLNNVLKTNPDHEQAKLLRSLVVDDIKKINAAGATEPVTPAPDATPPTPDQPAPDAPQPDNAEPDAPAAPGQATTLTEEQINLIKVFEVRLANKPNIRPLDNETLKGLLETFRDEPEMAQFRERTGLNLLRRLKGHEQLELLFKLRARDFYGKVQMIGDPEVMQVFKQHVYPRYVMPYFIRQFDGVEGLKLITQRANREDVLYTNYLILHRAKVNGLPVIDRYEPMSSLLIQWGLPRAEAKYPAPEVRGWRPYFTSSNDPRIKPITDWISTLWGETETYPIDFELPKPEKKAAADDAEEPAAR